MFKNGLPPPSDLSPVVEGGVVSAGIIASSVVYIEAVYAQKTSYATAMALTAISVFVLASIMAAVGRERPGHTFGS